MRSGNLRQHFRQLRRSLDASAQKMNAWLLSNQLEEVLKLKRPQRIAAYLATQGEISLDSWISGNRRHQIFLPKLYEPIAPRLRFAPMTASTRWKLNRFKIIEPDNHWGQTVSANKLDIVLLPLVAFDRRGTRLGMGGGYYDRSLASRRLRSYWHRPFLIGVAHSCQEADKLPKNAWDVGLDMIITEREIIPIVRKD